ncbi:MAG: hypothetical protein KAS72_10145 [Phycisphaerales bacterium]|nr:hypothetical protein [Phycisphaerales bacterium]
MQHRMNRPVRLLSVLLALLISAPGVSGAAVDGDDQIGPTNELVRTMVIPLDDGQLDVGLLVGEIADQVGLDGDAISDHITWRINLNGRVGRAQLALLESATHDIMTTQIQPDRLIITFDRAKLRRRSRNVRKYIRELITARFPEAAAAYAEQYGTVVHLTGDARAPVSKDSVSPDMIVLVHGMDDPGKVWRSLIPPLVKEGFAVCEFGYPDDQPIADSTALFISQLTEMRSLGVSSITLVAHSMGALVCREALTNQAYYDGKTAGLDTLPSVNRLIMVAPPNQGSQLARFRFAAEIRDQMVHGLSGDGVLFGSIFDGAGEAKFDLLPHSDFLTTLNARSMPTDLPITIIAGDVSPVTVGRIEPLIHVLREAAPDDLAESISELDRALRGLAQEFGDGVVTLESTRLDGVDDYVIVPGNHITMIRNVRSGNERIPPAVPIILDRLRRDRATDR